MNNNNIHPLYFPPPIMNPGILLERLNYVNRRPRCKPFTGRGLLRYFVSLQNPNNPTISRMTDELWINAAPHEKTNYTNLSAQINKMMRL